MDGMPLAVWHCRGERLLNWRPWCGVLAGEQFGARLGERCRCAAGRFERCARVRSCARRRASKRRLAGAWDALEQRSAWPKQSGGLGAGTGRNHGALRCPRPVAASADPGLLPGDRPPPVLAEELVEGLAEQGLDRPALGGAEQAQLAVDGRGKVAGDLDAAGTAVPGGPAGSGGCGVFACPRVRCGCFCIRHSALPGSRADRLAARVLRRRGPRTVSARACLPAGLSERSCALPPPDCRVYPGFARLAMGVAGATCPRCHDCCGLLACRALATRLARGPVSDWDDLSATAARTVGSAAWGRSAARPRPWPCTGPIPGRWGVCRACGRVR